MLGREGHGRTQAIKVKSSHAAPYEPQSHPLSAEDPIYSCWDKVSASTGSWDLAHLEIRVFPVIIFPSKSSGSSHHSKLSRAVQTLQIKNHLFRARQEEQKKCQKKREEAAARKSSWKAFKAKAKWVWLLDFQELFQEVLEAPVFSAELQEIPASTFCWQGRWGTTKKPLPWSNIVVQADYFFQCTWLLMIFLIHFTKNYLSHGIQAPAWLWVPNWKWIPAWLIPRASAAELWEHKAEAQWLPALPAQQKASTKSCTNTAQQQIQSHWGFRRGSGK